VSETAVYDFNDRLPVQSRITFKIACLTYEVLTTGQPFYTYDLCSIITHRTVPYAQLINAF